MLPERAFCPVGKRMTLEGGGGGSSSTTEQTTQNIDRRQVVGEFGLGISSDTSTISVNVSDQAAIAAANSALAGALDTVKAGDQLQQQGFDLLLKTAGSVMGEVFKAIDKNQQLVNTVSSGVADAYDTAQSAVSGNRDLQRYMLIIGGIVVLVVFFNAKGAK